MPMEQAAVVVGILCSILNVVLAFLHDWKVVIVRRDDEPVGGKDSGYLAPRGIE